MDDTARMTNPRRPARAAASLLAIVLALAGCRAAAEPSASAVSSASPSASVESTATAPASEAPSATASGSEPAEPSASASDAPGEFAIAPNADADALFIERDECENVEDGYRVEFPEAWWTNTAIGEVEPCRWFSPTFYEVDDPAEVPAEVAISVEYIDAGVGWVDEIVSRDEGIVGSTQVAVRVEVQGGGSGEMPSGWEETAYVVQLGPTAEDGPNLVIRTNTDMGGDYELNVAVLDRMMATMELIGTIQS
jgi:hypothetical protein